MNTALLSHVACLGHDPGPGHPESPERLTAVRAALEGESFMYLDRPDAPLATVEQLARVHPRRHVEQVLAAVPAGDGWFAIDGDTVLSSGSREAALRAAGAVIAGVDLVMTGEVRNAFCAVRPPGHHAEAARAMGFCLFNNVAAGAAHARAVHGARRVAVIDFDVHHGNGIEDIFWDQPDLFYASVHQAPLFPGTGEAFETGVAGNILNLPLAAGSGSAEFRAAVAERILPAIEAFGPDLVMISAGFDAHRRDPLADLRLGVEDFAWVTRQIADLAGRVCDGRIVSSLEGGYDLHALASCAAAHVRELMVG